PAASSAFHNPLLPPLSCRPRGGPSHHEFQPIAPARQALARCLRCGGVQCSTDDLEQNAPAAANLAINT
ncbi:MAG: hypothetical protein NT167_29820, partial [Verrucomicrobia bacterium]|nr:hypothetical protein [Verrucomicrobiota bacterium]